MRAAIVTLLVLTACPLLGADTLVIEGSSNVAAWRCSANVGAIAGSSLRIPIDSLRCGNRAMERDLRRTLKASRHPDIEFHVTRLEGDTKAETFHARIAGIIELAGACRDLDVPIEGTRIAADRVRLRIELPLRMSDFGLVPPTALFGMIRANDALVVRFDLTLPVDDHAR